MHSFAPQAEERQGRSKETLSEELEENINNHALSDQWETASDSALRAGLLADLAGSSPVVETNPEPETEITEREALPGIDAESEETIEGSGSIVQLDEWYNRFVQEQEENASEAGANLESESKEEESTSKKPETPKASINYLFEETQDHEKTAFDGPVNDRIEPTPVSAHSSEAVNSRSGDYPVPTTSTDTTSQDDRPELEDLSSTRDLQSLANTETHFDSDWEELLEFLNNRDSGRLQEESLDAQAPIFSDELNVSGYNDVLPASFDRFHAPDPELNDDYPPLDFSEYLVSDVLGTQETLPLQDSNPLDQTNAENYSHGLDYQQHTELSQEQTQDYLNQGEVQASQALHEQQQQHESIGRQNVNQQHFNQQQQHFSQPHSHQQHLNQQHSNQQHSKQQTFNQRQFNQQHSKQRSFHEQHFQQHPESELEQRRDIQHEPSAPEDYNSSNASIHQVEAAEEEEDPSPTSLSLDHRISQLKAQIAKSQALSATKLSQISSNEKKIRGMTAHLKRQRSEALDESGEMPAKKAKTAAYRRPSIRKGAKPKAVKASKELKEKNESTGARRPRASAKEVKKSLDCVPEAEVEVPVSAPLTGGPHVGSQLNYANAAGSYNQQFHTCPTAYNPNPNPNPNPNGYQPKMASHAQEPRNDRRLHQSYNSGAYGPQPNMASQPQHPRNGPQFNQSSSGNYYAASPANGHGPATPQHAFYPPSYGQKITGQLDQSASMNNYPPAIYAQNPKPSNIGIYAPNRPTGSQQSFPSAGYQQRFPTAGRSTGSRQSFPSAAYLQRFPAAGQQQASSAPAGYMQNTRPSNVQGYPRSMSHQHQSRQSMPMNRYPDFPLGLSNGNNNNNNMYNHQQPAAETSYPQFPFQQFLQDPSSGGGDEE